MPYEVDLNSGDVYKLPFDGLKTGDEIRVCVSNTIANVCHDAPLFEKAPDYYVGPYHEHMALAEKKAPAGGLFGRVRLYKKQ